MSDEDDPKALRERVHELEQTADDLRETVADLQQRRGPSRRDLLKVGSGGLLGAGLLASSQPVSAAPASADTNTGQVGAAGNSTDVVLDQLRDPGGDEILNVDDSGGINAQFGRTWHFNDVFIGTDSALIAVAASGAVTLSSGAGTVDTGLSATDATFYLALGIDDPNADAKIAGQLFWDDSAGTYKIDIQETDTSVGNPTVNYDVLRVR
jgi:hypothetical protein